MRHEYLCTRILQRLVLSRYCDVAPAAWRFVAEAGGRPEIDQPAAQRAIRFSIAHTDGLIVIALCADSTVGVDVEALHHARDIEAVARRFFAPEETAALLSLDAARRPLRFLQLWTLKEALLKALGTGLATPLDVAQFNVRADSAVDAKLPTLLVAEAQAWQFETTCPTAGHVLGLARRSEDRRIETQLNWFETGSLFRE